jgi:4-aminobutyrate aminotransferase / (S)-3-amino-2-methylpropionate transaminase / 5-aminovalerate transaminase
VAEYDLTPVKVPEVETKYRSIKTPIPVPESLSIFDRLSKSEPRSMMGQPPVVWDKAEGFIVHDRWGNRWIDWSSGVLITNIGHGHPAIIEAVRSFLDRPLLTTYVFVHEQRADLAEELQRFAPEPKDYRVFLLSTGSEATENCIKLAKTHALKRFGPEKKYILSFGGAYHGRTMGAQLAGGMEHQKAWIVNGDSTFIHVPFPDGFYNQDASFGGVLKALDELGITGDQIAGMITESYQGVGPNFFPQDYVSELAEFCKRHHITMIFDEVQSGFGRTGKDFAFQHYGVTPDLIACGKGVSSSLPLSAVIGRAEIMNHYAPGSMTSTHSGSPLSVAATLANLREYRQGGYVENSARMGEILGRRLHEITSNYADVCGHPVSKGLVGGVRMVLPGTRTPDPDTALAITYSCLRKGLLMFAPVGIAGECVKIAPPLSITEEALNESLDVFEESLREVLS